ncbi:MAG: SDR family oxidoreductase [Clostridium sp.]|nr:SDR family oxidoreductase [Clostridium sp.]
MGLTKWMKNFFSYIKNGGVVYTTVTCVKANDVLKGRNIIVTGGSSGIGFAIAQKCVECGAKVVIVGRNEQKLQNAVERIGENCKYVVRDLSEVRNMNKMLDEAEKIFGQMPDSLVNNAGTYLQKKELNYTEIDFDQTIATNLKGVYFLTNQFVDKCLCNGIKGNIVMMISNRGLMGDVHPYGISKAGLINYTCGLGRELIKKGIRINGVAPGMVASNINNIDTKGNLYNNTRGGRVLLPEEIAEVVAFLLSDASKCINGAVIPCDEGDCLR